jgi:hypothetical protein
VPRAEQTNKKLQLFAFVALVASALKQDQAENGNFPMPRTSSLVLHMQTKTGEHLLK